MGEYYVDFEQVDIWFKCWKFGVIGFFWIDVLMCQFWEEGWIYYFGCYSVVCFLICGGCYIDWECGVEVFEEWLFDYELVCNVGNW